MACGRGSTPSESPTGPTRPSRLTTTYEYNNAGELATTKYNDGITAGVTNIFNRRGSIITNICGTQVTTTTHDEGGRKLEEAIAGGPLSGIRLIHGYDSLLRRITAEIRGSSGIVTNTVSFDAASRIATVSEGDLSATYLRAPGSHLVTQTDRRAFPKNGMGPAARDFV